MSAPAQRPPGELRQRLVRRDRSWACCSWSLFFAIASGAPERYLSANNLRVVLAQTVIVALGAIGMTLVIVGGGIDLAVGSTIALTGVLCALAIRDGWAPVLAVLAAVAAGGASASSTGSRSRACASCRSSPRSGMLGVARGTAKWLASQTTVNPPETWVNQLAVTFPPAALDGVRARRLDRARARGG